MDKPFRDVPHAEAIVTFYNKRSRFGLSMEKLYTHKSKKKDEGETAEPATENEQDTESENYDQLTLDDAVNNQGGTEQ